MLRVRKWGPPKQRLSSIIWTPSLTIKHKTYYCFASSRAAGKAGKMGDTDAHVAGIYSNSVVMHPRSRFHTEADTMTSSSSRESAIIYWRPNFHSLRYLPRMVTELAHEQPKFSNNSQSIGLKKIFFISPGNNKIN